MSNGSSATSAVGYNDYEHFNDEFVIGGYLEAERCNSLAAFISETNNMMDGCHAGIKYSRIGNAEVKRYQKNQKFKPKEMTKEDFVFKDFEQWYWSTKWDRQDESCGNVAELMSRYMPEVERAFLAKQDQSVFRCIERAKSCELGGLGPCGSDLGTCDKPVVVDCKNVFDLFLDMEIQLGQQCRGMGRGRPYVVLPDLCGKKVVKNAVRYEHLLGAGDCVTCPIVNGYEVNTLHGFEVMYSNRVQPRMVGGIEIWPIFFGYKDAVKVARGFESARFGVEDPYSNGKMTHIVKSWGCWIPESEYVGVAYATFDPDCSCEIC